MHLPIPASVAGALLVGISNGLVNGFLVTKVRIHAVIATIGVGTMLTGNRLLLQRLSNCDRHPAHVHRNVSGAALFGVPNPVFIMAALLIVMWTILNKTDLGQRMQAVGSNIEAARLSGIRVDRMKMFAFATAGFCAALTGVLLTSLLRSETTTFFQKGSLTRRGR